MEAFAISPGRHFQFHGSVRDGMPRASGNGDCRDTPKRLTALNERVTFSVPCARSLRAASVSQARPMVSGQIYHFLYRLIPSISVPLAIAIGTRDIPRLSNTDCVSKEK
jgi:hypothetical protein